MARCATMGPSRRGLACRAVRAGGLGNAGTAGGDDERVLSLAAWVDDAPYAGSTER